MATTYELREQALRLTHQAQALIAEINDKTDESRANELNEQFDRMFDEAKALEARAAKMDEASAFEASINSADARRPNEDRAAKSDVQVNADSAIETYIRGGHVTAEQRGILRSLESRADQNKGTPADGGYTVPKTWADNITVGLKALNPMLDGTYVTMITTSDGRTIAYPTFDDTANTGTAVGEAGAISATGASFGSTDLNVYKVTSGYIPVSQELLDDTAYDIVGLLTGAMADRIGRKAGAWLTTGAGSGSSQPTGIVTAVGTPSKATANANVVSYADFVEAEFTVDRAYRARGRFMISETVEKQARKLVDSTGRPIFAAAMAVGAPNTINNKEYLVNGDMTTAVTSGSVGLLFGDFSKYVARNNGVPTIKRLNEVGALNDQVYFLATQRWGGILTDSRAIGGIKFQ